VEFFLDVFSFLFLGDPANISYSVGLVLDIRLLIVDKVDLIHPMTTFDSSNIEIGRIFDVVLVSCFDDVTPNLIVTLPYAIEVLPVRCVRAFSRL